MNRLRNPILLIMLLFSVFLRGYGQNYRLTDNFNDNHNNWYQGDKEGGSVHVVDGKLKVICDAGWSESLKPAAIFEKDFTLQASFRQIDGVDNNGVGLMWGHSRNEKQHNFFIVNATGSYYVGDNATEMETKKPGIREWVASKSVKPMGEVNVLRIEQRSGTLTFYINTEKVFSCPMIHWRGTSIGVITFVKMSFEVDDLSWEQEGLKINLPPTLTKGFVKENLGPNINTPTDDLSPQISADGKHLYFGREYYSGNLGGDKDGEDIWISTFDGSSWGLAENLGQPLNSATVDNLLAVSADNNSMLFSDASRFLIRHRTADGWSNAEPIGTTFENKGENFESCLSADGKAILFTARNGTNLRADINDVLERDIFAMVQDQNGTWSAPFNIGPNVNTVQDELGVFLAADGKTLYFSTNGRPGYGGYDLFFTKRLDNGWKKWSEPVNMGPEINTTGFDAYYVLSAAGDYAYMVSNQNGLGKTDIVRVKQAKETKPDPVVLVRGKTLDAKTKQPISADIHIDNLSTRLEVGEGISDPATGDFKFVLPFGVNYGFHASAPGHLSVNDNLELVTISTYSEIEKNLYLVPIEVGANIQLNNVFFEQGRPILKPESYPELDRLVQIMKENPTMEIELRGYTDNQGREASLIVLSMNRVGAVKKYMTDKGIPAKRIGGKGLGPASPVVKNDTEEHRRMNRRVEFKVLKK